MSFLLIRPTHTPNAELLWNTARHAFLFSTMRRAPWGPLGGGRLRLCCSHLHTLPTNPFSIFLFHECQLVTPTPLSCWSTVAPLYVPCPPLE